MARKKKEQRQDEALMNAEQPIEQEPDDDINADIQNTIMQAEGTFNQRNGVIDVPEQEKEKRHLDVINSEAVSKFTDTLMKYMSARSKVDARIKENQRWWARRYETDNASLFGVIDAKSNWLFNSIMNKLADYSDNIPEPNIIARNREDVQEAEMLKHRIPAIMQANNYEQTYLDCSLDELVAGASVDEVGYDSDKNQIALRQVDLLKFYYQAGIDNIEDSEYVFKLEEIQNHKLNKLYPETKDNLNGSMLTLTHYDTEEQNDTSDKSILVHCYYKKDGLLHYCLYVNNVVLFATENEPDDYPNGWYDDGEYPFVVTPMFKQKGSLIGFSYLDVCKNAQMRIDRIETAIDLNTLVNAIPRYFKQNDSDINEKDFLDLAKIIILTNSPLDEYQLKKIETQPLGANVLAERDAIIQELKQTSGNSDINTGVSSGGITAASAIAQLVETGSKGSRLAIKGSYRSYVKRVYKIIERIRQFDDDVSQVRITNDDGSVDYVDYTNAGLKPQQYEALDGTTIERKPEFDIEVTAQKASPYNKMSQNEFALQCYHNQFFNPQNADATLACLNMMDFDHKDDVIAQVQQNTTLFEENMMLKQMLDRVLPMSNLSGQEPQQMAQPTGQEPQQDSQQTKVDRIRQKTADATEVR